MRTLIWILTKVFPALSFWGMFSLVMCAIADDGLSVLLPCAIVGAVLFFFGFRFGRKAWEYAVPPAPLWFMSDVEIMNSQFITSACWGGRFFLLPFAIAGVVLMFVS